MPRPHAPDASSERASPSGRTPRGEPWPDVPYRAWAPTCETLQRWSQIVGKVRLALAPHRNHWWQVALYVTARGLRTSPMPLGGARALEIEIDFLEHAIHLRASDGASRSIPMRPQSVADVYAAMARALGELGADCSIWTTPVEVAERTPFEQDRARAAYDPDAAQRFWRALVAAHGVMETFQSRFLGKVSPTHFFWGSFDLAATRFSGRRAPPHPGSPNVARFVMREAYSHELSSFGFWPGHPAHEEAAFYAYAYPEPEGFAAARILPAEARYDEGMRLLVLPYDVVRRAPDPEETLLSFFQSAYDAAADLGRWDRVALDRPVCLPG